MKEKIVESMRLAIGQAEIAKSKGENPFGAVLLDSRYNICHVACSRSIEYCDPSAHAEILVIREYCQKNRLVYLRNYKIVCSGEPCVMCSGAIKWAKIDEVYFSVSQEYINKISGGKPKPTCESMINTGNKNIKIQGGILFDEGFKVFNGYSFIPQDGMK